ncbi:heavy-metal-binding protein [Clostridium botulinum]|uniref:heavy-metal-associated domain-containing protein n=1 Tax=Clostridium botulinum TaxID=1491 RepID=UPI00099D41B6|nr:cation transporter [Clostridium botulinum]NFA96460.1 heavy-metal-binding protein [Clostridium botulinum]NFB51414.1 heavy-metal-binding protein [Clostridium botulinum]NFC76837.1 heavy-metal-binding protein [Clostridium botulinum]NFC87638.1 heavy-metal-binding protein [Clostridium botulinum]NFD05848.1 heavy-metal-binding protein [Clostridium botulinum]
MFFNKKSTGKEIELKVEGMMCNHCEIAVKEALQKVDGVKKVKVSHFKKRAFITLEEGKDVEVFELIRAVKSTGYDASEI